MTTEEKVSEAKRLMFEVAKERMDKKKKEADSHLCRCGHERKDHSPTYSINYTEGFCSKCKCENFLIKKI